MQIPIDYQEPVLSPSRANCYIVLWSVLAFLYGRSRAVFRSSCRHSLWYTTARLMVRLSREKKYSKLYSNDTIGMYCVTIVVHEV